MKAWAFETKLASGNDYTPQSLKLHESDPIPVAEPGTIVVKVHATSLNPVDYKVGAFGFPVPFTPGLDVAGVVHQVGDNVSGFKVGDRVYYMGDLKKKYGGFAEYGVVDASTVTHIPDEVSFVDAAALPVAAWTAWTALHDKARIRSGEWVLITAGAGGVGSYAIQLAKLAGAHVITTCSAKNNEFVKKLGADYTIDYNTDNIEERVKEITKGRGVDFWIDMIGNDSADQGLKCLKWGGSIVIVQGNPKTPIGDLFTRQIGILDVFLGGHHNADPETKKHLAYIGTQIINLVKEKKLDTVVKEVISFDQIPAGLEKIKGRHVVGKIVAKLQ